MMRVRRRSRRQLVRSALAGGDAFGKAHRLARALVAFVDFGELGTRLARLQRAGVIEHSPGRWQLVTGIVDMLRFWVFPHAGAYHEQQDFGLAFYQFVRFLAEPASIVDPVGLFTDEPVLIGHVMRVAHDNPQYDLQLLQMFEHGVDKLVGQLDAVLAGTHPHAAAFRSLVEEPDYQARLRAYLDVWRRDPTSPFVRGADVASDAERTFGTVTVSVRYMNRLPRAALGALWHLATTRTLSPALVEPRATSQVATREAPRPTRDVAS